MAKIISLFNHKGGVSKTTTTFHLGSMLTRLGQKVLLVDVDPQCNLTGLVLGIEDHDNLFEFYKNENKYDIYNSLAHVFSFDSKLKKDISKEGIPNPEKGNNPNLSIIAGHPDFARFDLQIATAMTSSSTIPVLKPFISSINSLIRKTAERNNFDVVLVDMSPNISATNMCIFMASDYFIVPTSPDFFCYQSIGSLAKVLPMWDDDLKKFKDGQTLPEANPKMLGIISQNYRVYDSSKNKEENSEDSSDGMSKEFKKWNDKIEENTNIKLIPILKDRNMIIDRESFKKHVDYSEPYNLANIQNFNSLIPASQRLSKPMFDLVKEDLNWYGSIWEKVEKNGKPTGAKYNILKVCDVYEKMATAVANMIGLKIVKTT